MPLYHVNGGWKYGRSGHLYHGAYAYDLAVRQGRAIAISKARRAGHYIPYAKARPLGEKRRQRQRRRHPRLGIYGKKVKLHRRRTRHVLRSGKMY